MTPTEPQKLGRYEILEEIGKGAMGVVYLARDPLIGRLVALKTFRAGFAAKDEELAQFRSRFVREAQSAGILSHPNIVTIHDVVDEGANGVCFIAMEYVKGTNLKQLLQRTEPFSPAFVADLVAQIADALDYAHSRGVVHRDIKPANILITADNKVKITDFGIARLDTSNLTMEGQLLGTPNYMAPEQIQARDVDHRADIFSLGVVFYEILTRKKPFQGENLTQVTHKIVYEPFTPPEEIVRGLAPAMSKILTRCLEKDPNRRYPRASEVARELRAVIEQAEDLDDTAGTQEVTPLPGEPEMIPTRRLDRAEIAAAVAAEAGAAPPPAPRPVEPLPAVPPPAPTPPVDSELAPTRRLDREAIKSAAAAAPPAGPPAAASSARTVATPVPTPPRPAPAAAPPPVVAPQPAARVPAAARSPAGGAAAPAAKGRAGGHRGLWWAIGGAAVLVLAVGTFFAVSASREPSPPPVGPAPRPAPASSIEQQSRIVAATALADARARYAEGDLDAALAAVARAELAEPDSLDAKVLREAIEKSRRDLAADAEREVQVTEGLAIARAAISRKAWEEAVNAGRGVLALDPQQEEARRLVSDAQRELRREREQRAAEEAARQAAAARPVTPPPVAPQPEPVAPVATDAGLRIAFASDQSEGVLTIYAGERQILREPFKFVRKTGFMRTEKISGTIEAERRLPVGPVTLRVYVSLPGKPTKSIVLEQEIAGGGKYQLDVRTDAAGRTTAELR